MDERKKSQSLFSDILSDCIKYVGDEEEYQGDPPPASAAAANQNQMVAVAKQLQRQFSGNPQLPANNQQVTDKIRSNSQVYYFIQDICGYSVLDKKNG